MKSRRAAPKRSSKPWEVSLEELRYFRDHLQPDDQREFDAIQKRQGNAAAFGGLLSKVLAQEFPRLSVHLPDNNVTIMPQRSDVVKR